MTTQQTAEQSTDDSMSTTNESEEQVSQRHEAKRVFAAEFNDASYVFTESDSDMAPNYTLLPTGERANRVLMIGTLMEIEDREAGGSRFVNGRINDGHSNFFVTASRYQKDAASTLRNLNTPTIVVVVGKPNHWENNEGEHRVNIRPEAIVEVTNNERYEWVMETVDQTINRIEAYDNVTEQDVNNGSAPSDIKKAMEVYDIDPDTYLESVRTVLKSLFELDNDA